MASNPRVTRSTGQPRGGVIPQRNCFWAAALHVRTRSPWSELTSIALSATGKETTSQHQTGACRTYR